MQNYNITNKNIKTKSSHPNIINMKTVKFLGSENPISDVGSSFIWITERKPFSSPKPSREAPGQTNQLY
jgi:hypothetical protein